MELPRTQEFRHAHAMIVSNSRQKANEIIILEYRYFITPFCFSAWFVFRTKGLLS